MLLYSWGHTGLVPRVEFELGFVDFYTLIFHQQEPRPRPCVHLRCCMQISSWLLDLTVIPMIGFLQDYRGVKAKGTSFLNKSHIELADKSSFSSNVLFSLSRQLWPLVKASRSLLCCLEITVLLQLFLQMRWFPDPGKLYKGWCQQRGIRFSNRLMPWNHINGIVSCLML